MQLATVTGDVADAEEVVQEAFARALGSWRRVSRYDNPEAWVYRVAVNLARSRLRRARVATAWLRRQGELPVVPALGVEHLEVLHALRDLPDRQREAVVLHYLVDLPVQDVAERLGVPTGTVKSWLARGRRALADSLGMDEEVPVDG